MVNRYHLCILKESSSAYHLLHKLNYVKCIQYSVVHQIINIIDIICENFRTIP